MLRSTLKGGIALLMLCTSSLFGSGEGDKLYQPVSDSDASFGQIEPDIPTVPTQKSPQLVRAKGSLLRTGAVLTGLLLLLFGFLYLFKRISQGGLFSSASHVKRFTVVERQPLSPKTMLYLVESDDTKYLLSESQIKVELLDKIPVSPQQDLDL